jgi:hypothetical protein
MKTKISLLVSLTLALLSSNANSQISIVFNVDATGYDVAPYHSIHLAGTFATVGSDKIVEDWNPAATNSRMGLHGNNIYSILVTFPASSIGQQLQYLFVRNNMWNDCCQDFSEGNPGETSLDFTCAVDDICCGGFNRVLTIPSYNAIVNAKFDQCGIIKAAPFRISDVDATAETQLVVYPNPATDMITLIGLSDDAFVRISNFLGQVVWSGIVSASNPEINVSGLPAGNYVATFPDSKAIRFNIVK